MNAEYARRVAVECDELLERMVADVAADSEPEQAWVVTVRTVARAATTLHMLAAPTDEPAELQEARDERDAAAADYRAVRDERDAAVQERDALQSFGKRWHQAATQRDALVRAARPVVDSNDVVTGDETLADLRRVVERVESDNPAVPVKAADALRRELWHVLGRAPGRDYDLIAAVRTLARDSARCGPHLIEIETLRRERDEARVELDEMERATAELLDKQEHGEPGCRVEFEVTGDTYAALVEQAGVTVETLAAGHPYRLDGVSARPHVSTGDGRIVMWRADVAATIYEQE